MNTEGVDAKFNLMVNTKQLKIITDACELLSRLHINQLDAVLTELKFHRKIDIDKCERAEELMSLLKGMKIIPPLGIPNDDLPERPKIAFDIYQVTRQALAFHRKPEGDLFIDFDNPLQTSKENLPTIEKINI